MPRKNPKFTCDDIIRFFCRNLPTYERLACRVRLVGDFCEDALPLCDYLKIYVEKGGGMCDIMGHLPKFVLRLMKRLPQGRALIRALEIFCESVNIAFFIYSLLCEDKGGGDYIGYDQTYIEDTSESLRIIAEETQKAIGGSQLEIEVDETKNKGIIIF